MLNLTQLDDREIHTKQFRQGDALLVIDGQPTFMEGGGLAVPGGKAIVPYIAWLINNWNFYLGFPIFGTRDMHSLGHITLASSFWRLEGKNQFLVAPFTEITLKDVKDGKYSLKPHALFTMDDLVEYLRGCPGQKQTLWSDHGLFDTEESKLHPDFDLSKFQLIFPKGMNPRHDSNSAFKFNDGYTTGFTPLLKSHGVKRLFMIGYVFDVCVGMSGLDAADDGFEVVFIKDMTTSVSPEGDAAMMRMIAERNERYGEYRIKVVSLEDLLLAESEAA